MAAIDYGAIIFKNGKRYKGDQLYPEIDGLGVRFYKCGIEYCDLDFDEQYYSFRKPDKKVFKFEFKGAKFKVKKVTDLVMDAKILYHGDNYHAIFGYGIDNNKSTWNEVKHVYHSKSNVRKIDNILAKLDY